MKTFAHTDSIGTHPHTHTHTHTHKLLVVFMGKLQNTHEHFSFLLHVNMPSIHTYLHMHRHM